MIIRIYIDPRNKQTNNWDAGSDSNVFQCFNPQVGRLFHRDDVGSAPWLAKKPHVESSVFRLHFFAPINWWDVILKLLTWCMMNPYICPTFFFVVTPKKGGCDTAPWERKVHWGDVGWQVWNLQGNRMQVQNLLMPGVSTASPSNWATKRKKPGDGKKVIESHNTCGGEMVFWDWLCSKCIFWIATCMVYLFFQKNG